MNINKMDASDSNGKDETQTTQPAPTANTPYSYPQYSQFPPNAGGMMMHPHTYPGFQMMYQMPQMVPQMMYASQHPAMIQQQTAQNFSQQQTPGSTDIVAFDRAESEEILIRRRRDARDAHLTKIAELEEAEAAMREREQVMLQEIARVSRERKAQEVVASLVMYVFLKL